MHLISVNLINVNLMKSRIGSKYAYSSAVAKIHSLYFDISTNTFLDEMDRTIHARFNSTARSILEKMKNAIDKGQIPARTLLDITKAFHSVNHVNVLGKYEIYGIRGQSVNLFESYLENRQQMVIVNDYEKSAMEQITVGVPQESI